jgi:hypothetical protein
MLIGYEILTILMEKVIELQDTVKKQEK